MKATYIAAAIIISSLIFTQAQAAPSLVVTSSYNQPLGVIEWQVKVQKNNPAYTGSLAVEIPMTLTATSAGFAYSLQSAGGDDTNGAANRTWYYNETAAGSGVLLWNIGFDPADHTQLIGANPFTGTNTEGLYINTASQVFFSALGSSVNLPNPVPTLHIASSDAKLQWSNVIVGENGVNYTGINGMATSVIVGDMNGNGAVNSLDLVPFQLAMTNPAAYQAAFPGLDRVARGDINHDGQFNSGDVFPIPEPTTALLAAFGIVSFGLRRRSGR